MEICKQYIYVPKILKLNQNNVDLNVFSFRVLLKKIVVNYVYS